MKVCVICGPVPDAELDQDPDSGYIHRPGKGTPHTLNGEPLFGGIHGGMGGLAGAAAGIGGLAGVDAEEGDAGDRSAGGE